MDKLTMMSFPIDIAKKRKKIYQLNRVKLFFKNIQYD